MNLIPKWLRRSVQRAVTQIPSWGASRLPAWAKIGRSRSSDTGKVSVCIETDTDAAYTEWFGLLGNPPKDQYWLEVAYQCIKLDLQAAISGTRFDPRRSDQPAEFHMRRADNWAQRLHPVGRGAKVASEGKEARAHYVRVRGSLPM